MTWDTDNGFDEIPTHSEHRKREKILLLLLECMMWVRESPPSHLIQNSTLKRGTNLAIALSKRLLNNSAADSLSCPLVPSSPIL